MCYERYERKMAASEDLKNKVAAEQPEEKRSKRIGLFDALLRGAEKANQKASAEGDPVKEVTPAK
jgi:hypothetical protein